MIIDIVVAKIIKIKSAFSYFLVGSTTSAPLWYDTVPKLFHGWPIKDVSLIVGIIFTLLKIYETKTIQKIVSYFKSKFGKDKSNEA